MRLKYFIIFFIFFTTVCVSQAQTIPPVSDSLLITQPYTDSAIINGLVNEFKLNELLKENYLLNFTAEPVQQLQIVKQGKQHFYFFYIVLGLGLLLGIVRVLNARYFDTLFRVFFNTSLRQSQLTDQLEQAKLLSLFYNIFFCINFGLFLYLIIENYFGSFQNIHWKWLQYSLMIPFLIYLVKYIILIFIGWVSGYKEEVNIYIFITFLINKIMGIILLPFIFLIAFTDKLISQPVIIVSIVSIIILFISRYFRSYNLLQHRLKFGKLHFFIFIFALEMVPLLVLYKVATHYLSIN